jgi:hypothetical protein
MLFQARAGISGAFSMARYAISIMRCNPALTAMLVLVLALVVAIQQAKELMDGWDGKAFWGQVRNDLGIDSAGDTEKRQGIVTGADYDKKRAGGASNKATNAGLMLNSDGTVAPPKPVAQDTLAGASPAITASASGGDKTAGAIGGLSSKLDAIVQQIAGMKSDVTVQMDSADIAAQITKNGVRVGGSEGSG